MLHAVVRRVWHDGGGLQEGSSLPISKLAGELIARSRTLVRPILKFERPTPASWQVVQRAQHVRGRHLIELPVKQGFERQGVQGLHVFFARTHRSLCVRVLNLTNLLN